MNNKKKILIFFLLFISIIDGRIIEKKTEFEFKSSFNGCKITNIGYYGNVFTLCSTAFYDCEEKLVIQTDIYALRPRTCVQQAPRNQHYMYSKTTTPSWTFVYDNITKRMSSK